MAAGRALEGAGEAAAVEEEDGLLVLGDPLFEGAAQALGEALRHQPDDAEAFEQLASLAQDPAVSGAVRDTLWSVARSTSLDQATRTRLLLWLAELEEIGGDVASAEACLAAIDDPAPGLRTATVARWRQWPWRTLNGEA